MRVTVLKSNFCSKDKGGLEKAAQKLVEAFVNKGCEVTVLTTGEIEKDSRCNIVSLGPSSKFSLFHYFSFDQLCNQWLKKNASDIIFGMERNSVQTHYRAGNGVHAVYLQRRKKVEPFWKKCSFSLNPLHRYILRLEKKSFENPSLQTLFVNSEMVKREILHYYATPEEKIAVIHNGVEWEQWETSFKQTTFTTHKPHQFLFIGHGFRRKGLLYLLQGLSRIKNKDFFLTVVGKDKESVFFQRKTSELQLEKKVAFVGRALDPIPFFQNADTLVIPSLYDPFANVTVEALAMGLYVVSSAFNGGCEVLSEKSGCIIEDIEDPDSVANSLEKAMHFPKTESRAKNIRESIKQLDFSHQLDKIVRLTCTT